MSKIKEIIENSKKYKDRKEREKKRQDEKKREWNNLSPEKKELRLRQRERIQENTKIKRRERYPKPEDLRKFLKIIYSEGRKLTKQERKDHEDRGSYIEIIRETDDDKLAKAYIYLKKIHQWYYEFKRGTKTEENLSLIPRMYITSMKLRISSLFLSNLINHKYDAELTSLIILRQIYETICQATYDIEKISKNLKNKNSIHSYWILMTKLQSERYIEGITNHHDYISDLGNTISVNDTIKEYEKKNKDNEVDIYGKLCEFLHPNPAGVIHFFHKTNTYDENEIIFTTKGRNKHINKLHRDVFDHLFQFVDFIEDYSKSFIDDIEEFQKFHMNKYGDNFQVEMHKAKEKAKVEFYEENKKSELKNKELSKKIYDFKKKAKREIEKKYKNWSLKS
jgi:hypothetical protein